MIILGGCSFIASNENLCQNLSVHVAENDTINFDDDSEYGVGDDNIFTYQEFYLVSSDTIKNIELEKLNDYNLSTAYLNNTFNGKFDTLYIINDYSEYPKVYSDTALVIDNVSIFNGNRLSLNDWEKSIKVKDMEIHHKGQCFGKFSLENTYKAQFVNLNNGIPILYGTKDSIMLVIKSVYAPPTNTVGYSISEVKLDGYKKSDRD